MSTATTTEKQWSTAERHMQSGFQRLLSSRHAARMKGEGVVNQQFLSLNFILFIVLIFYFISI